MASRRDLIPDPPPVPPRVHSLIGMRFGRLIVRHFAGMDKHSRSFWCCECDCGNVCRAQGAVLLGTCSKKNIVRSCGCLRADPGIRKAARAKVPAKKRAEICKKMRAAVRNRKPAYAMDRHRAAELLGVSVERIDVLIADGLIGSTTRRGEVWVSSGDVSTLLGLQQRKKAKCRMALAKTVARARRGEH